jgi:phosphopantothenoylcysteine synthetase/decarboxylase
VSETHAPRRVPRLLLCATGGYECSALPAFIFALLRHCADDVQVVMTHAAEKLSSRYAIEVASRHFVFVDMDDQAEGVFVPHIELSRRCEAIVVYPATVNILGKVANGIADELVSALIIAAKVPVFFVPVTNHSMWEHPATQRNVQRLTDDGYAVLPNVAALEVATREGLPAVETPFPFPTLLVRLQAAMTASTGGARLQR